LLACTRTPAVAPETDRPNKDKKNKLDVMFPILQDPRVVAGEQTKKKKPAEIFDSIVQLEVQDFTQMMMTGVVGWAHMLLLGSG